MKKPTAKTYQNIVLYTYTYIHTHTHIYIYHRRLKGGAGGARAPPIFRKKGLSPPKFLFLATYPTKRIQVNLIGVDETVKSFDVFAGHNDGKTA